MKREPWSVLATGLYETPSQRSARKTEAVAYTLELARRRLASAVEPADIRKSRTDVRRLERRLAELASQPPEWGVIH